MSAAALISKHARVFREACSEHIVPVEVGTAYLNTSFPRMYDLNFIDVEKKSAGVDEIVADTERILGEARLGHRKFFVDDERLGTDLMGEVKTLEGWEATRLLDMTWEEDPGRSDAAAAEFDLEELRELRERLHRSFYGEDDDLIRQFIERDHVYRRAGNGRFFGVRDDGGKLQCSLNLFHIGNVAEIDDVQTAEPARGRGYGAAAVLAAARAARRAGAEMVFLCADEDDWPKEMYGRLGFAPAGRRFEFLRKP